MQQIVLSPSRLPQVAFDGELLVSACGEDVDGATGGRWHDLTVYRTESGEFAVVIAYRTNATGESEDCSVEMAQDESDVDSILSLYDPKGMVVLDDGPDRKRLVDTLVRHYDLAVNDVLTRLQSVSDTTEFPAKPR